MGYEIDFLPVGEGKDGGDAIALRYGNLFGDRHEQTIIVIDGGYKKNGEMLVNHIAQHYGNPTVIDLVILTHPDIDHASGLTEIFEHFKVRNLLMHKPWDYSEILHKTFVDGRITPSSLESRLRKNLGAACEIETVAKKQKEPRCNIYEAFAGVSFDNNILQVLSPTKDYFLSLVPQFEKTPDAKEIFQYLKKGAISEAAITLTKETWEYETLDEIHSKETTAENLSSTILLFTYNNTKILLSADAGTQSFLNAMDFAYQHNIDLSNLNLVQIPHHGSKHNIGKKVLNRLLGKPQQQTMPWKGASIASVAKDSDVKHPSRKVTNAFLRRGYPAYQTKGITLRWSHDAPNRNWQSISPLDFFEEVDD